MLFWIASKARKLSRPRIYPVHLTSDLQIGIPVLPSMRHHEIVSKVVPQLLVILTSDQI